MGVGEATKGMEVSYGGDLVPIELFQLVKGWPVHSGGIRQGHTSALKRKFSCRHTGSSIEQLSNVWEYKLVDSGHPTPPHPTPPLPSPPTCPSSLPPFQMVAVPTRDNPNLAPSPLPPSPSPFLQNSTPRTSQVSYTPQPPPPPILFKFSYIICSVFFPLLFNVNLMDLIRPTICFVGFRLYLLVSVSPRPSLLFFNCLCLLCMSLPVSACIWLYVHARVCLSLSFLCPSL